MYNNFPFPQNYGTPTMPSNFGTQGFSVQRQEIIKVHGKNGAEAFPMQPNTEVLLLDDTQAVVWHKKTDGAGYPMLNGYSITPLKTQNEVIETKYDEIEKRLSSLEAIINAKPNIAEFSNVEYQTDDKNVKGRK